MKNVVILRDTASRTLSTYNRTAKYSVSNIDNGDVVLLDSVSTEFLEDEVWVATLPTAERANDIWMVHSPEVPFLQDERGNSYLGITQDPRDFTNLKGRPMDVFKPNEADVIEMTGTGITGIATESNKYLIVGSGSKLEASSALPSKGIYFERVKMSTLKISEGKMEAISIPTYIYHVKRI